MVHIYNVTTALRMCHASVFSMRDFKHVSEHIQRNAQDNTRQRESRNVQHTYQDSHIRYTAVIQSSPTPQYVQNHFPTVAPLGINMT